MEFIVEFVFIIIYGLLGAGNFRNAITTFMDGCYFLSGMSFMALITVIVYMIKMIIRF